MNFVSLTFLIFFIATLVSFYLVPKKGRWVVLLVASYGFYAVYNWLFGLLLLAVSFITYLSGLLMGKGKNKKAILVLTLIFVFGNLFIFKYLNFTIGSIFSIAQLFGSKATFSSLSIILPMGISFYTFQTLSYVIDVYRGRVQPDKNFFSYSLFVTYFPQLVAGPIERYEDLMPQLKNPKQISFDDIGEGIKYILIGYFKKIAIADVLAIYVDQVYGSLDTYSGTAILFATILFAFQILADFDGYSTIAIGVSSLFGIKLTKNFDEPYLACNIKEYWNRWHITLTRWFRDYVYIPLGGNRKGRIRKYINIMIVFLLSGLWHGADLTFVIWGAIHGMTLVIYYIITDNFNIDVNNKFAKAGSWLVVSLVSLLGWVFFRSQSLNDATLALQKIFTSFSLNEIVSLTNNYCALAYILLIPLIYFLVSRLSKIKFVEEDNFKSSLNGTSIMIFATLLVVVVAVRFYLVSIGEASSFIYFEF